MVTSSCTGNDQLAQATLGGPRGSASLHETNVHNGPVVVLPTWGGPCSTVAMPRPTSLSGTFPRGVLGGDITGNTHYASERVVSDASNVGTRERTASPGGFRNPVGGAPASKRIVHKMGSLEGS